MQQKDLSESLNGRGPVIEQLCARLADEIVTAADQSPFARPYDSEATRLTERTVMLFREACKLALNDRYAKSQNKKPRYGAAIRKQRTA